MLLNSKIILIPILLLIFILGFSLRIYKIGTSPPGFSWDEASLGYNAYSILKTGRDEYGQIMPLIFKSFGDYKPGVYVYLTVPFIFLFGLNEFAARLPSILIGSLIPLAAYFVIKESLQENKEKIALITTFLMSISPWAINFSRGAWEANIAFFEILLAIFFFLKAKSEKIYYLYFSIFLLCLSIYTYQSAKLFSLLIFLSFLYAKKDILKTRKKVFLFISIVFIATLVSSLINSETRSRLAYLNQFSYPRKPEQILQLKKEEVGSIPFQMVFFHSETLEYFKIVFSRYLSYFSPKFLFVDGPPDGRQGVLGYGMMHIFEFPFLILGLVYIIRKRIFLNRILFFWILFAPIPAALSRDLLNTTRSLPLIVGLEFLVAVGIYYFYKSIYKNPFKTAFFTSILFFVAFFNLGFYLDRLFVHSKFDAYKDWLGSYKEAILYAKDNERNYKNIIFTTAYNEPYIFYLFYTKYNPSSFQKQANLIIKNPPDVGEIEKIDNIIFTWVDWQQYRFVKDQLLIGVEKDLPFDDVNKSGTASTVKMFYNLDKTVSFHAVKTH